MTPWYNAWPGLNLWDHHIVIHGAREGLLPVPQDVFSSSHPLLPPVNHVLFFLLSLLPISCPLRRGTIYKALYGSFFPFLYPWFIVSGWEIIAGSRLEAKSQSLGSACWRPWTLTDGSIGSASAHNRYVGTSRLLRQPLNPLRDLSESQASSLSYMLDPNLFTVHSVNLRCWWDLSLMNSKLFFSCLLFSWSLFVGSGVVLCIRLCQCQLTFCIKMPVSISHQF